MTRNANFNCSSNIKKYVLVNVLLGTNFNTLWKCNVDLITLDFDTIWFTRLTQNLGTGLITWTNIWTNANITYSQLAWFTNGSRLLMSDSTTRKVIESAITNNGTLVNFGWLN